jgi:nucleoside-diphosphate-sugar epimerase
MNNIAYSNKAYQGVRTVVLGASGFVGRWVARALSLQGAALFLVDQNRSRSQEICSKYAISGEIAEVESNDHSGVPEILKNVKPSITFNLAGYGVIRSELDEKAAYSVNVHLVKAVAQAVSDARDPAWPGQNMVHVGTAMEYGNVEGNLSEDSIPKPTTLYGKSKLAGALAFADCCQTNDIKGITARLFMLYGPGEHEARLLPSLMRIAQTGESLKLTSGLQRRDFTYIEDVAEGLLRLGLCKAKPGEIVNLATGKLTSVRHFAELAAQILNIESDKLEFGAIPTRAEEMKHSDVTVDRARQLVGVVPATGIEEGITKTKSFMESDGSQEELK